MNRGRTLFLRRPFAIGTMPASVRLLRSKISTLLGPKVQDLIRVRLFGLFVACFDRMRVGIFCLCLLFRDGDDARVIGGVEVEGLELVRAKGLGPYKGQLFGAFVLSYAVGAMPKSVRRSPCTSRTPRRGSGP